METAGIMSAVFVSITELKVKQVNSDVSGSGNTPKVFALVNLDNTYRCFFIVKIISVMKAQRLSLFRIMQKRATTHSVGVVATTMGILLIHVSNPVCITLGILALACAALIATKLEKGGKL